MAIPTTNATEELPAINQILASVGQAPVTTLDQTNPDVAIAYDTLIQVSREIQSEGWTFNKEQDYPFTPDSNSEILIPNNVLQIDISAETGNEEMDVIRRSGKLYDKQEHTYTFTEELKCDVVWLFDWVDLPRPIQDYIVARATCQVVQKIVGDPELYKICQDKEGFTRAMAMEYECNQGQYTYFGQPRDGNAYISYKPYKALTR